MKIVGSTDEWEPMEEQALLANRLLKTDTS